MSYTRYANKPIEKISFNNKDCYTYYGMVLTDLEIEPPQRKVTKVSSTLTDGDVDITDSLSSPKYNNRKIKMSFAVPEDFDAVYRSICLELNGMYFDKSIVIANRRYSGRVSINKWRSSKTLGTATIEVDAQPYCYDVDDPAVKRYE